MLEKKNLQHYLYFQDNPLTPKRLKSMLHDKNENQFQVSALLKNVPIYSGKKHKDKMEDYILEG